MTVFKTSATPITDCMDRHYLIGELGAGILLLRAYSALMYHFKCNLGLAQG